MGIFNRKKDKDDKAVDKSLKEIKKENSSIDKFRIQLARKAGSNIVELDDYKKLLKDIENLILKCKNYGGLHNSKVNNIHEELEKKRKELAALVKFLDKLNAKDVSEEKAIKDIKKQVKKNDSKKRRK